MKGVIASADHNSSNLLKTSSINKWSFAINENVKQAQMCQKISRSISDKSIGVKQVSNKMSDMLLPGLGGWVFLLKLGLQICLWIINNIFHREPDMI